MYISHIASKISKSVGIIDKLSNCLANFKACLKTLYNSVVYPYFQYCFKRKVKTLLFKEHFI